MLVTPRPDIDAGLVTLRRSATPFACSSIAERLALLRQLLHGWVAVAEPSVLAGCRVKGLDPASPAAAEEWLAGPTVVVRILRLLIESLERLARGRPTVDPARVRATADARTVVEVFPVSRLDRLFFAGFTGEVWMKPGVTPDDVVARAAAHYRAPIDARPGTVCLVLGAGNVASIPPTDVVHKMFVEGKVCVLKMNPVNEHVGPFLERAFRPAVDRGLLSVVYGGPDVGAYLADHPEIDEIHITGSDRTHDTMVWGPPGPEREARKAAGDPRLKKAITSELGNVTPVIVVPGPYTDAELAFQGESIAAAIVNNASFNCNAAKMLVQPRGWAGAERLHRALADVLRRTPSRRAYYPGAEQRWHELVGTHPAVECYGTPAAGALPWAIIRGLDPGRADEPCFSMEPWCALISEVAVGSSEPAAFLDEAVRFVNERLWGTLACTVVVHPASLRDPRVAAAFERAVRDLRYGTVCINHWSALGYAFGSTPWGGHPSTTLDDIQSGRGWVHNTVLLAADDIEKCVIRGPLTLRPKPPWFPSHRTAHTLGRRMVSMEASPSLLKLPGLVVSALTG